MTMIDDQATTARQIHHPDWCNPLGHCEAELDAIGIRGEHYAPAERVKTHYGPTLWIGLTADARDENNPSIALRVPEICSDDDHAADCEHYNFMGTVRLEPEEAMMLARRLTEAVDQWHAARRDRPTSR